MPWENGLYNHRPMDQKKNILKFVVFMSCPFLLYIGVYLWMRPQWEEKEVRKRKEILSDTAKVNEAHRTYERIHHQLLMEDPDYAEIYEENQELKERLYKIRTTAEDMQQNIDYFEQEGYEVDKMQSIIDDILEESSY